MVGKDVMEFKDIKAKNIIIGEFSHLSNFKTFQTALFEDEKYLAKFLESCERHKNINVHLDKNFVNEANECIQYLRSRNKFWSETSTLNCSFMQINKENNL